MMEEKRYKIENLSELEFKLIINALKVWRGDFRTTDEDKTAIWNKEITELLVRLGFAEKGWQKKKL